MDLFFGQAKVSQQKVPEPWNRSSSVPNRCLLLYLHPGFFHLRPRNQLLKSGPLTHDHPSAGTVGSRRWKDSFADLLLSNMELIPGSFFNVLIVAALLSCCCWLWVILGLDSNPSHKSVESKRSTVTIFLSLACKPATVYRSCFPTLTWFWLEDDKNCSEPVKSRRLTHLCGSWAGVGTTI